MSTTPAHDALFFRRYRWAHFFCTAGVPRRAQAPLPSSLLLTIWGSHGRHDSRKTGPWNAHSGGGRRGGRHEDGFRTLHQLDFGLELAAIRKRPLDPPVSALQPEGPIYCTNVQSRPRFHAVRTGGMHRAVSSMALTGVAAAGLMAAACNAIFGLDDVSPLMSDGGTASGAGGVGGSMCGRELLRNGGFEMGMMGWFSAPEDAVVFRRDDDAELTTQAVAPHSPPYLLRLGGGASGFLVSWIDQQLDLPADALEVTISGYLLVKTDEEPDDDYDSALVELTRETATTTTSVFRSIPRWTNRTPAATWTPFSIPVNVASFAGTQVMFRLAAELDQGVASYFFFDSVSLTVTGCRP